MDVSGIPTLAARAGWYRESRRNLCIHRSWPLFIREKSLLEEFLKPMDLSQNRLALAIGVPPRRINEIVLGKRGISADTALRLARYFRMSSQFWMGLLELDHDRLDREVRPHVEAG